MNKMMHDKCHNKMSFETKKMAKIQAKQSLCGYKAYRNNKKAVLKPYKCPLCKQWHLTSKTRKQYKKAKKENA